ncbi:macrophage mannose receptor 1 [Neodiprion lecontei]|uniref:Macrophage mannose receptor 1 n=1 Tax=Neodiprion lecontei TaxID=441921 RepID=A0A6J0BF40_NEOLC|nr:macrophage mannose receptor 1 [Neodiprion lecontei]
MAVILFLIQVLPCITLILAQPQCPNVNINFLRSPYDAAYNANLPASPPCLLRGQSVTKRDDYTYTSGIGGYKVHTRAVLWNEARITCEEEGGHLAIFNSVAEANVVTQLYKKSPAITGSPLPQFAGIGFHDLYREGQYVTIHGQTLAKAGFTQWAPGQPDNIYDGKPENCGSLDKNGGLNDIGCDVPIGFVCELPAYCYTPGIGGHKFHTKATTWNMARKLCESEGAHLAIVNSAKEAEVIGNLFTKSGPHFGSEDSKYAHIGFHDLYEEGEFVTIDGKSLETVGFYEWRNGGPNNANNEDCGSVDKNGRLNDIHCTKFVAFVCELPDVN